MTNGPPRREDYAVGWAGYQAGSVWLGTQLLQMILTATFVPSASLDTFDLTQELMKVHPLPPLPLAWPQPGLPHVTYLEDISVSHRLPTHPTHIPTRYGAATPPPHLGV